MKASQDLQVLNKQSSKAFRAPGHPQTSRAHRNTVWLLPRTPDQSNSQDRAQSEEQVSGNSLGSTEPDHLGSGLCQCQAGGQITGAARLAPANGVASGCKGQVQSTDWVASGFTKGTSSMV